MQRETRRLILLLLPAGIFFSAFFLIPMAELFLIGGTGKDGWAAYAAIITNRNYFNSLLATLGVAVLTTIVTLAISGISGVFLQRHKFPGNAALVAMLTFPLAFPGVVIGFMVIMLAGRQGLIGTVSEALTGDKIVFAYSLAGLFMGYVYFSIPRTILTVMAAAEKTRPETRRSRPLARRLALARRARCHHPGAEACLHLGRRDLLRDGRWRFWHGVYAGRPDQRAADGDLYRIHPVGEYRHGGCAQLRARRSHLDRAGAGAHGGRRHRRGGRLRPCAPNGSFISSSPLLCWSAPS
jgi:hypothetical protein